MEAVRPACRGLTELVPEVLQHILRLLDDDTTYRILPRVCRRFKALIGSPEFVRARLLQGHSVLLAGADGPEERRRVRAMLRPCAIFPVLPDAAADLVEVAAYLPPRGPYVGQPRGQGCGETHCQVYHL